MLGLPSHLAPLSAAALPCPGDPNVCPARRKTAEHVLGLLITVGQAIVYVMTGMYGEPSEVGAVNGILIVLQVGGCWGAGGSAGGSGGGVLQGCWSDMRGRGGLLLGRG